MRSRSRMWLLTSIMTLACLIVAGASIVVLYRAALAEQRERLVDTAKSRARFLESVAEYNSQVAVDLLDENPSYDSFQATMRQVRRAHARFPGFGSTGEFTLARKEGGRIVFLLRHRHFDLGNPDPVPLDSKLAEPMRLALSGRSGTVIGPDYRGETVLAAYEPLPELGLGIVAKIDLSEVREPFIQAGLAAMAITILVVGIGVFLFRKIGEPLVKSLEEYAGSLEAEVEERRRTEAQLRDSRQSMQTLLGNLPGMAYRCRNAQDWPMEFVSEGSREITGYAPEELVAPDGRPYGDLIHPEDRDPVWETVQKALALDAPFRVEYRIRDKAGEERWLVERGRGVGKDLTGEEILEGFVWDATEQKQAEAGLKESEKRFRQAVSFVPFPLMIHAEGGEVVSINEAWTRITGYTQKDIPTVSRWLEKAYGDEDSPSVQEVVDGLFDIKGAVREGEFIITTASGEKRIWDFSSAPLGALPDGRRVVISVASDITEAREYENQLRQSQKMDAVGRLAGGVAHDFNNMLNVILGYAELAMSSLEDTDPIHHDLAEIHQAAKRSAELTRQLLAFSRKQLIRPKVVNLNFALEQQKRMLSRLIGENIRMEYALAEDLKNIHIDPSQVDQIMANLAVNARDAIGDVGEVTVETANVVLDETYSQRHLEARPGEYVMLAISDTGAGMDADTLERIFEPFFTTKGVEEGTGLGLATVYGIVKQNKGVINVYSEPEIGTTFKIYFPCFQGEAAEPGLTVEPPVSDGNETVLVVEDQEQVLDLAEAILTKHGYQVFKARTPAEALRMGRAHPGPIHLLLTDVVMPAMNGKELAERLKAVKPEAKILYMSGYTANVIAQRGVLDEGVQFIQKPFSVMSLAWKVRQVLDEE